VRQCKRRCVVLIHNKIVIPFFDAEFRGFDHAAVILPDRLPRPAGLPDPPLSIQKRLKFRYFMISHSHHSPCPRIEKARIPTGTGLLFLFYYATFSFASAASVANASLSFTASSASIFLFISTFASFRPC